MPPSQNIYNAMLVKFENLKLMLIIWNSEDEFGTDT